MRDESARIFCILNKHPDLGEVERCCKWEPARGVGVVKKVVGQTGQTTMHYATLAEPHCSGAVHSGQQGNFKFEFLKPRQSDVDINDINDLSTCEVNLYRYPGKSMNI